MPDHEQSQDSRDGSASPDPSDNGSSVHRQSALKDRKCPFCAQQFTSSSLGRHLDTYIREKNPKPADGIHNVNEIRNIRGGITRRHARTSAGKDTTQKKPLQSPVPPQRPLPDGNQRTREAFPQPAPPRAEYSRADAPPYARTASHERALRLNAPHWTSTGVINNLPPRGSPASSRELPPLRGPYAQASQHDAEERRNAAATEQALKEVLQAVHDAAKRVQIPELFDFNFVTQSYPALCLRLLQPKVSSLLEVPTRSSVSDLSNALWDHIKAHHTRWQRARDTSQQNGPDNQMQALYEQYSQHVERALNDWNALDPELQHSKYKEEIVRAYAEEATRRKTADTKVAALQEENEQLKYQLATVHTSGLPYLSQAVIKSLIDQDDLRSWTFDHLVTKNKSNLSHNQNLSYATHLPPAVHPHTVSTPRTSEENAPTPGSNSSYGLGVGHGGHDRSAGYSGWGLADGVPRPDREWMSQVSQGQKIAPGLGRADVIRSEDVQMTDASAAPGAGASGASPRVREIG